MTVSSGENLATTAVEAGCFWCFQSPHLLNLLPAVITVSLLSVTIAVCLLPTLIPLSLLSMAISVSLLSVAIFVSWLHTATHSQSVIYSYFSLLSVGN